MGDSGTTAGSFCAHHKSDKSILFQALLEQAQVNLGKLRTQEVLKQHQLETIETQFRKIMGEVSAYKNIPKYLYSLGLEEAGLNEKDLLELDELVVVLGNRLNQHEVPLGWVNYATLSEAALSIAEFTTALRTAECVFHQFLKEESKEHNFSITSRYINRLSKVSHMAMVLQDFLDKNQF